MGFWKTNATLFEMKALVRIVYSLDEEISAVKTLADADCREERLCRKLITENIIGCCGTLVQWKSKPQSVVALNSKLAYICHLR